MTTTTLPLPPGNLGLPWLGETLSFLRDSVAFGESRRRAHGPVFKTHLFGRPTVMLAGPEAMRFVFTHDKEKFVVAWPASTVALLGEGSLAVTEGESHQRLRKVLQQVFGNRQIAAHVPLMDRIAGEHLARWAARGTLALCPPISAFTFHIACALILGDESQVDPLTPLFETWLGGLFSIPVRLPFTAFGRALAARAELLARVEAIVRARLARGGGGEDALRVLLDATDERGDKLTRAQIMDMLVTLLFAGHDTSSSALASFCLLTAQHPEVLARLREEQRAVALDGPLTVADLQRMPYLDQVVKETLRFIPPVGGAFRRVKATCEVGGYQIPAGWSVLYSIGNTHRVAANFTAPDRFDPDRFGPDRAEDKQARFSWVPFGGGPRVCIGMEYARLEMAVMGARLCREYEWSLVPGQDLTIVPIPTPRPKSGLVVRFRRAAVS